MLPKILEFQCRTIFVNGRKYIDAEDLKSILSHYINEEPVNLDSEKESISLPVYVKDVNELDLYIKRYGDHITIQDRDWYFDMTIRDFHNQECCEEVYADWGYLKNFESTQLIKHCLKFEIALVEGEGFLLRFICRPLFNDEIGSADRKFFVPCYNEQNGYYSDKLELQILYNYKDNDGKIFTEEKVIDLSNAKKDKLY